MIGSCVDPALAYWGWERITSLALGVAVLVPAGVVAVLAVRAWVRRRWSS